MDKDQEIRNMLEHIAGKEYTIRKRAEGIFYLEFAYGMDSSSLPSRDHHNFIIDFNKKTIEVYSYDESHHNGDHYNCSNTSLGWEKLLSAHDSLVRLVRHEVEKEVMNELKNTLANKKLAEILKGNIQDE